MTVSGSPPWKRCTAVWQTVISQPPLTTAVLAGALAVVVAVLIAGRAGPADGEAGTLGWPGVDHPPGEGRGSTVEAARGVPPPQPVSRPNASTTQNRT